MKDEIAQLSAADSGLATLSDPSNFDARFKDVDQMSVRATVSADYLRFLPFEYRLSMSLFF